VDRRVRALLLASAGVQAVLALMWVLQVPLVTGLLPLPDRSPLTNILIGSFLFAAAGSIAACLYARSDRALAALGLEYTAIFAPLAVLSFARVVGGAAGNVAIFGVVCVAVAVVGLGLLRWSLTHAWSDPRPIPPQVRRAFFLFVAAFVIRGVLLIVQVPSILPWEVAPELSTFLGCMFVGGAAFFVYGLVDPRWENARAQLAAFLAYDAVLILPLIAQLPTVEDRFRLSLVLNVAFVIISGLLTSYYLFVNPGTRLRRQPAKPAAAAAA
jgi:hypothetical protein